MSQIDTTPPVDFRPQPEAFPPQWDDLETAKPVPDLYLPRFTAVHNLPSERITCLTHVLAAGEIRRIVDQSESGIGARVTLLLDNTGNSITLGASQEALSGQEVNTFAAAGVLIPGGFHLPATPAFQPTPFILHTSAEIWVRASSVGPAVVSVLIEQFYGD